MTDVFRFAKTVSDCSIESLAILREDITALHGIVSEERKLISRMVDVIVAMTARLDTLEAAAKTDRQG